MTPRTTAALKNETDFMHRVLEILARSDSEDALLTEIAQEALHFADAEYCDILLRDLTDSLVLRASTNSPEFVRRAKLGKGVGICGQVLASGAAEFVSHNVRNHPRFAEYPGLGEQDTVGVAVLPLVVPGCPPKGVILLARHERWRFTPSRKRQLLKIADTVAQAVVSFRRAYQAGLNSNRLGALSEVTKTIANSPYLEEILQLLVSLTAQQFNYRVCTVRLLDEARGELVLRATQAPAKAYQKKRAIKLGESIAGRAIAENRPIVVPDVEFDEDYIGHDLAAEQGLKSMICVPLTIQDRAVGVMSCYTSEVRNFAPDEIKALETLAKQAAVSIEHAKLQVRNTLMQEMHHRVKNNLQQVGSLLRLQMRHSSYRSLEEALGETLNRILAISAVHDLLSREDLDHVGMKEIAEALVHQHGALVPPTKRVAFQVRGDNVHLSMNQATQVALVLNELIANAIEHGFELADQGEVHVTIEQQLEEISVWVSNSGDPLPENFDPLVASHLGLQIVENLSRALGGRFKMSNIFGWTVCEVKFQRATGE